MTNFLRRAGKTCLAVVAVATLLMCLTALPPVAAGTLPAAQRPGEPLQHLSNDNALKRAASHAPLVEEEGETVQHLSNDDALKRAGSHLPTARQPGETVQHLSNDDSLKRDASHAPIDEEEGETVQHLSNDDALKRAASHAPIVLVEGETVRDVQAEQPAAGAAAIKVPDFQPSHEFKAVLPNQAVPMGLHIRMNMETGLKEARYIDVSVCVCVFACRSC